MLFLSLLLAVVVRDSASSDSFGISRSVLPLNEEKRGGFKEIERGSIDIFSSGVKRTKTSVYNLPAGRLYSPESLQWNMTAGFRYRTVNPPVDLIQSPSFLAMRRGDPNHVDLHD